MDQAPSSTKPSVNTRPSIKLPQPSPHTSTARLHGTSRIFITQHSSSTFLGLTEVCVYVPSGLRNSGSMAFSRLKPRECKAVKGQGCAVAERAGVALAATAEWRPVWPCVGRVPRAVCGCLAATHAGPPSAPVSRAPVTRMTPRVPSQQPHISQPPCPWYVWYSCSCTG